jgi:beta-1,3-galactosyltransferase 1
MTVKVVSGRPDIPFLSQKVLDVSSQVSFHDESYCSSNHTVIILVKTGLKNQELRDSIRHTWGREAVYRYNTPVLFVMGQTADLHLKKRLTIESYFHNDIIQGSFIDTYYNLTVKTLFALNYANEFCSNIPWILYVDDDAIVNIPKLHRFISYLTNKPGSRDHIHCRSNVNAPVNRNPESKWYWSQDDFKDEYYPSYCTGIGYLLPIDVSRRLYDSAMNPDTKPKLWIDDIFVTGVAAKAAAIKHKHTSIIYPYLYDDYFGHEERLFVSNVIVGELKTAFKFADFWTKATSPQPGDFKTTIEKLCGFPICWPSFFSFLFVYCLAKVMTYITKPFYKMIASRVANEYAHQPKRYHDVIVEA